MKNRYKGLTVIFKKDESEYKTTKLIELIEMLDSVESVKPVLTENVHDYINRQRVRVEFYNKIVEVMETDHGAF